MRLPAGEEVAQHGHEVLGAGPVRHVRARADGEAAIAAATSYYAGNYLAEVSRGQERRMTIVDQALQQSIHDTLSDLQARLERQHEEAAKGKDTVLAIRTTNEQIDALVTDLKVRQAELARCRVTSIEAPRVVRIAAVIPGPCRPCWSMD